MYAGLKEKLLDEMYVDVVFFQLDYITFPTTMIQRFLQIAIQNQTNTKETFVQQAILIRQETQKIAQEYISNATIVNQTANAESSYIVAEAEGQSLRIVQKAKEIALMQLFQALNITENEDQNSFLFALQIGEKGEEWNYIFNLQNIFIQN